jgi:sulfotransferase
MTKTFAFMAGLPRSGSTLLASILNQNPRVYSSPNSPMCGMMFNLERSIVATEQWNAFPKPDVLSPTVMSVINAFYSDVEKPFVIDKSREWSIPEHLAVLQRNLGYKPKVLMPVRSIVEILASFIRLVHMNPSAPSFIDREIEARQEFNFYRPADDTRCDSLMRPKGMIDNALYGLAFSMQPEAKDSFHIIEYDDLVSNPKETVRRVYDFLELPYFDHDFSNLENVVPEDDKVYGLRGMHDVRSSLAKRDLNIERTLSQYVIRKYSGMEFWRQND